MRKWSTYFVLLICLCIFSGCCIKHQWQEADCVTQKTCLKCGKTDGEAMGHSWIAATCTAPKSCAVCGETEGEIAQHTWMDATCLAPQTCSGCGITYGSTGEHDWMEETCEIPVTCAVCGLDWGEPRGHNWIPATCIAPETCYDCGTTRGDVSDSHLWSIATTEEPMTCDLCGQTRGERIITDPRFKTEKSKCVFGSWKANVNIPINQLDLTNLRWRLPDSAKNGSELSCLLYLMVYIDGTMDILVIPEAMTVIQKQNGNVGIRLDMLTVNAAAYYVEEENLYIGLTWDDEMIPLEITWLDKDCWTVEGDLLALTRDESRRGGFHIAPPGRFFSGIRPETEFGLLTFERVDAREIDNL